jgi:hypothetical protein
VAKYKKEICPLCLGRGAKYRDEKACMGVELLNSSCGESQALHHLRETGNKLKLTISPREKLASNSQACPVCGMGW